MLAKLLIGIVVAGGSGSSGSTKVIDVMFGAEFTSGESRKSSGTSSVGWDLVGDEAQEDVSNGPAYLEAKCRDIESSVRRSRKAPMPLIEEDLIEAVPAVVDESTRVNLGSLIGGSASSRVFSIKEHPEWAIKYQSDCEERKSIHPLTREFWMLKRIERLGISPRAIAVSDGAYFTPKHTRLTSKTDTEVLQECSKTFPTFRYLIMDRVEESLHAFVKRTGPLPVKDAISLGIDLISALEKIHALNIVHGDIFQRNVCFDSTGKLVLIDFGRALIVTGASPIARRGLSFFSLFSPWEMMGYRASFRDDLFRVLQLMGFLMNGLPYFDRIQKLSLQPLSANGEQPLFMFKARAFIFELSTKDSPGPVSSIPDSATRNALEAGLGGVLNTVRHLQQDQMPDHSSIIGQLQNLVDRLETDLR